MAKPRYWFKARNYGWGWGLPQTWQGWMTYIVFTVIYLLALVFFVPRSTTTNSQIDLVWLGAIIFIDVFGLLIICFKHGESPEWRWHGKAVKKGATDDKK